MPRQTKATRTDQVIVNAITKLGNPLFDKSAANEFGRPAALSRGELEDIYRGTGLGRRIIDLPVQEMTRAWFRIEGDVEDEALGYLETLHAKQAIADAQRWADLYGGSMLLIGLDDGSDDLEQPVNEGALASIVYFECFERSQVTWTTTDLYKDRKNALYNQPEFYQLSRLDGPMFRVHETRLLKFTGAPLPPRTRYANQFWGDSMLQSCYDSMKRTLAVDQHAAVLIEEWSVGKFTMKNLLQLIGRKDGEAAIRQRLATLDLGKSMIRSLLMAEGETFERASQSVGGLPELMDRLRQQLAADTSIPATLLYGEPPSGLQATGVSNRKNWYDEVRSRQESKLLRPLERLVRYVYLCRDAGISEPDNWKIEFNNLEEPSALEDAQLRKTVADADAVYINASVLHPEEVAISRFGGDRYSIETEIDESLHQPPTAADLAAEEAMAKKQQEASIAATAAKATPKPNGGAQ